MASHLDSCRVNFLSPTTCLWRCCGWCFPSTLRIQQISFSCSPCVPIACQVTEHIPSVPEEGTVKVSTHLQEGSGWKHTSAQHPELHKLTMQPKTCQQAAGSDLSRVVASEGIGHADFSPWTTDESAAEWKRLLCFWEAGKGIMSAYTELETAKGGRSMTFSLSPKLESCFNLS